MLTFLTSHIFILSFRQVGEEEAADGETHRDMAASVEEEVAGTLTAAAAVGPTETAGAPHSTRARPPWKSNAAATTAAVAPGAPTPAAAAAGPGNPDGARTRACPMHAVLLAEAVL